MKIILYTYSFNEFITGGLGNLDDKEVYSYGDPEDRYNFDKYVEEDINTNNGDVEIKDIQIQVSNDNYDVYYHVVIKY